MVKSWNIILAIAIGIALFDNIEGGSIATKIPKIFYCYLRNICNDIQKFIKCMLENSKNVKEKDMTELKELFDGIDACKKMPKECNGTEEVYKIFKAYLVEITSHPGVEEKLNGFAGEIKAMKRCAAPPK